jgi:hypothetical protein
MFQKEELSSRFQDPMQLRDTPQGILDGTKHKGDHHSVKNLILKGSFAKSPEITSGSGNPLTAFFRSKNGSPDRVD